MAATLSRRETSRQRQRMGGRQTELLRQGPPVPAPRQGRGQKALPLAQADRGRARPRACARGGHANRPQTGVSDVGGRTLVAIRGVCKVWGEMLVLDRIDLEIRDGEFVALLGPSGSGKSTLLRVVTGLAACSEGEVDYRGEVVRGPSPHMAMVFQTFALYPWLTVLENVEIGLKAAGQAMRLRREKAKQLIDLVGLDGFEDAYPRELSGGMRQRVGFARALAVEPELLCMDEPFSALDVLTADNLRNELLDLWVERRIPTRSILMVTHGIEEAVFMADRIVILSRNPARVVADLALHLPRPRNRKDPAFLTLVDRIYKIISEAGEADRRRASVAAAARAGDRRDGADADASVPEGSAASKGGEGRSGTGDAFGGARDGRLADARGAGRRHRFVPLPDAPIGMLTGLLELVADRGGRDDLYHLGSELLLEVDDLLPVTEAAELLGLAVVREGDLFLTAKGVRFAAADVLARKQQFAEQIRALPVFALIHRVLEGKRHHTAPREFFRALLADEVGEVRAEGQLDTAVAWGRYAELFAYDLSAQEFYLPDDSDADQGPLAGATSPTATPSPGEEGDGADAGGGAGAGTGDDGAGDGKDGRGVGGRSWDGGGEGGSSR